MLTSTTDGRPSRVGRDLRSSCGSQLLLDTYSRDKTLAAKVPFSLLDQPHGEAPAGRGGRRGGSRRRSIDQMFADPDDGDDAGCSHVSSGRAAVELRRVVSVEKGYLAAHRATMEKALDAAVAVFAEQPQDPMRALAERLAWLADVGQ